MIPTKRMPRARAALLLEVLVSLAILVTLSMAISAVVRDSSERLSLSSERVVAEDMARSALAQIEAGIATPESLNGPVPAWDPAGAALELGDEIGPRSSDEIELGSGSAEPSGWVLQIDTQPSPYDGLTLVSVRAEREETPGLNATIHQLIRFRDAGPEGVGELDEISELLNEAGEPGGRP